MIIPPYECTRCGYHNAALTSNLRRKQTAKNEFDGNLEPITIRSIATECSKCGKQKIITGVTD